MRHKPAYIFMLLSLFVIGCSNTSKHEAAKTSGARKSMNERYSGGGIVIYKDGQWFETDNKRKLVPLSDGKFLYKEERENSHFRDNIEKTAYKTGDYEKKSWWGKKSYEVKEYKGDTDGSRFHKTAAQQGLTTPYGDKQVPIGDPYKTNTLDHEIARETNTKRLVKPRNDYTESKRGKLIQPPIMDWQEYRKLNIEETRSFLGR